MRIRLCEDYKSFPMILKLFSDLLCSSIRLSLETSRYAVLNAVNTTYKEIPWRYDILGLAPWWFICEVHLVLLLLDGYDDATNLRELIRPVGRLIAEDPTSEILRFTIPRSPRPLLQDLTNRMGRMELDVDYAPPGYDEQRQYLSGGHVMEFGDRLLGHVSGKI
nr:hypothetical protein [Tanacetum cinerariifolium]